MLSIEQHIVNRATEIERRGYKAEREDYEEVLEILVPSLSTCTTTQVFYDRISVKYIGRPVDEFFLVYGPPAVHITLDNGDRILTWRSGAQRIDLPTTTGYQAVRLSPIPS